MRLALALLFCCGLRHALRQSLCVVVGCLGNGRLRQQWACISVGTGCLGNGWLPQQWACISVVAGCLGNGGRPPPQSVSDRLHRDLLKSWSCSSHWASPNALSLQYPGRAHCPSLAQSQVQPSQVSGCRLNRAPGHFNAIFLSDSNPLEQKDYKDAFREAKSRAKRGNCSMNYAFTKDNLKSTTHSTHGRTRK